jgi:hypothetical protein
MQTTISKLAFVALLLLAATAHAQDVGPSRIYDELTSGEQTQIDALYTDRPPTLRGWNWGSMMKTANGSVKTNMFHAEYPFRWWSPNSAEALRPFHPARSATDGMAYIMAPVLNFPDSSFMAVNIDTTRFPWYADLYKQDTTADRGQLRFNTGMGPGPSLGEGLGFRFHPELNVSDTASFTPRAGDQQGAVFGFATRDLTNGTVPTSTSDANYHRYVLDDAGITGWTTVLSNSWPDQRMGR